jgi:hypothetical protein
MMRFRRLPRRLKIYAYFNTWGVVGVLLVTLGATGAGPRALLIIGLAFLCIALIDVAVVFPILRARRDLRRRRRSSGRGAC